jgi:Zn-dependent peptidase ImmA (M78 family)
MGMIRKKSFSDDQPSQEHDFDMASKLLDHADKEGISRYPLDVEALAKSLGIEVRLENMAEDISGTLEKIDDKWTIQVNRKHHPRRRRYTIAHELGHYCLHRHQESLFEDIIFFRGLEPTKTERQANIFASEILMPEYEFAQAIENGITNIEQLAERFGVSSMAIRVRAKELGYAGHGL